MRQIKFYAKYLCALTMLCGFCSPVCAATRAAAVTDDGYAGKVLNKILDTNKVKFNETLYLRLSLDEDGKLLECRSMKGGDAKAACDAAREASPFGSPPYGLPTYINIVLWSPDKPNKKAASAPAAQNTQANAAQSQYLAKVKRELRNSIYIPVQTKPGTYHATARIRADAKGKILESSIVQTSGDALLDKYVLQGIERAGKVAPPPADMKMPFDVTFTLLRQ